MERNMEYSYILRQWQHIEGSKHVDCGHVWRDRNCCCNPAVCYSITSLNQATENFIQVLKSVMKHNFFLCVFTMAGTVMALYYQTFIEKLRSCPIKLAYGQSGTGKTTALHYGLGLMGVHNLWFFCDLSPAKVFQLCLVTSKPVPSNNLWFFCDLSPANLSLQTI